MKLIDYLFYITASIFYNPKECDDSRMRASGLLSLWLSGFTQFVLSSIGLIIDNPVSRLLESSERFIYGLVYLLTLYVIFYIRYWRRDTRYLKIVEWRNGFSTLKRRVCNVLSVLFFVGTPIVSFVTFRLYVFGYL